MVNFCGGINTLGWHVGASPIELGIGGDFSRDVEDALAELAPLRGDEIRSKLSVRLRRAAQWLGSSLTRTSEDDAILDLSTALECFLASKSDKRKGEAIAVRSVLLLHAIEGRFPNPLETLGLYELRSDITHGEARQVSTENDVSTLRWVCLTALRAAIKLAAQSPMPATTGQLFARLETGPALEGVREWLGGIQPPPGMARIAKLRDALLDYVEEKLLLNQSE